MKFFILTLFTISILINSAVTSASQCAQFGSDVAKYECAYDKNSDKKFIFEIKDSDKRTNKDDDKFYNFRFYQPGRYAEKKAVFQEVLVQSCREETFSLDNIKGIIKYRSQRHWLHIDPITKKITFSVTKSTEIYNCTPINLTEKEDPILVFSNRKVEVYPNLLEDLKSGNYQLTPKRFFDLVRTHPALQKSVALQELAFARKHTTDPVINSYHYDLDNKAFDLVANFLTAKGLLSSEGLLPAHQYSFERRLEYLKNYLLNHSAEFKELPLKEHLENTMLFAWMYSRLPLLSETQDAPQRSSLFLTNGKNDPQTEEFTTNGFSKSPIENRNFAGCGNSYAPDPIDHWEHFSINAIFGDFR